MKYTVSKPITSKSEQAKRISWFAPKLSENKFKIQNQTWGFSNKREANRFAKSVGGTVLA